MVIMRDFPYDLWGPVSYFMTPTKHPMEQRFELLYSFPSEIFEDSTDRMTLNEERFVPFGGGFHLNTFPETNSKSP